ncbi:toll/interleukin-1 receptor domain-containing protein [Bacillus solimangrovi]|uniref:TIR domain-containing protein n=1 Tax=Bacillus solimangrovi TaxID=1305675 RepID=A0A1E5LB84_9BACI|nr:toll/interleukin-1 receptor domain-containing protein [Bacillus solimangrovi]OEH91345.1 hypothetical protein BFG57_05625 [Bacillus solimangrovi]
MGNIFISYSSADTKQMLELVNRLESYELKCWYAKRNIGPGENYAVEIIEQIASCKVFIILISRKAFESRHVATEISLAYRRDMLIIPLLIEDLAHDNSEWPKDFRYFLETAQMFNGVHLTEEDWQQIVDKICEQLELEDNVTITSSKIPEFKLESHKVNGADFLFSPMEKTKLDFIESVYEPNPNYLELQETLQNHRVLVLYNQEQTGKSTAGIHILQKIKVNKIFKLHLINLVEILQIHFKENSGYLLEYCEAGFIDQLSHQNLIEPLQNKLEEVGSFIIFTTIQQPSYDKEYIYELSKPINTKRIIEKHIHHLYPQHPNHNKALEKLQKLNISEIEELFNPGDSHLLAKVLIEESLSENMEEIKDSLSKNIENQTKILIEENMSMDYFSQLFTLVALRDVPYKLFEEVSFGLKKYIQSEIGVMESKTDYIYLSREQRLKKLKAETYMSSKGTLIGSFPERYIRFSKLSYSEKILEYLWNHYPQYHNSIIQWLNEAVVNSKKTEKKQLISVIVHLARQDFIFIQDKVLQPWVLNNDYRYRLTAIQVLNSLSEDQTTMKWISNLLNSWTKITNHSQYQWVTSVAYGGIIGAYTYPIALKNLKMIFINNRKEIRGRTIRSFSNLLSYGVVDSNYRTYFIVFLEKWYKEIQEEIGPRIVFYNLLFSIFTKQDDEIIEYFIRNKDLRKRLFEPVLAWSLNNSRTVNGAQMLLDSWLIVASKNKKCHKSYRNLIRSIITECNEYEIEKFIKRNQHSGFNEPILPLIRLISKEEGDMSWA